MEKSLLKRNKELEHSFDPKPNPHKIKDSTTNHGKKTPPKRSPTTTDQSLRILHGICGSFGEFSERRRKVSSVHRKNDQACDEVVLRGM
jgi:hypothetical protein